MIRILEGENIQVLDTRMSGKYQSASIRVPEPTAGPVPAKGSIVFYFETATGILRNQLNFCQWLRPGARHRCRAGR